MENSLNSDPGRLYSWLWDSHISPKNSKWLQENLTDMDAKVKMMIRLIESDADSFGRRAEMYYKKRPELMKLVEEFYRAYRALAERYDHATAELRHAHRTMAKAFPNELSFVLPESLAPCSQGPGAELHTPEKLDPDNLNNNPTGLSLSNLQTLIGALTDRSDSESGVSKKVLKQINEMFGPEEVTLPPLKPAGEREQDGCMTAETVEILKEALAAIKYEKKVIFLQYLQSFDWAVSWDREPSHAQKDDSAPEEWPSKAETEVNTLRESLVKCEAERDTWLLQHRQCLERISNIESMVSRAHANATGIVERAVKAETETQDLKFELTRLESERQTTILQFKQCLEKVSALEDKISCAEEDAQRLADQTNSTEVEVQALKQALAESNKEKESIAIQYKQCQDMISKLKSENSWTQVDAKKLKEELKDTKEHCAELEKSNYSLQLEVGDAAQKIIMKDQELQKKLEELEKLKIYSQNENSHFLQAEAALFALQTLHSQTLEEHGASVLETKNALRMVKDLEACIQDLKGEIQWIKKENSSLKDVNMSSTVLRENMEDETIKLRSMKSKLEEELADERSQINSLQKDISYLKEEIKDLNWRYQALVGQLESVDLDPKCVVLSVKSMRDDNIKLTKLCENGEHEIETLSKKLENSGILLEKNALLEQSLLEERKMVRSMQESYQTLIQEKSALAAEKAALFSQFQTSTYNMQTLLEKNTLLDQSLSAANIELQGLKEKSKWLEESCSLLNTEKSSLLTQRETLVSQLEVVEQRLESLKKGFTELEKRYTGLEVEKERILHQVEELQFCLSMEKQEQASFVITSEAQLVGLKNHINLLQEESQWWRKEFEDALKNTVNAQTEIFILQRCMQDVEENNICLLNDCQKHIQAFEFSEELISQLECENLEQQVELEVLMDEIEKHKTGIYNISKALQTERENEFDREQLIIRDIEEMKSSLLRIEDERQKLLVENWVLLNLIKGLGLEGAELETNKKITSLELKNLREMLTCVENDKDVLQECNRLLLVKIGEGDKWGEVLQANIDDLNQKLVDLQGKFKELLKENSKEIEEKTSLSKEFFELTEEMCLLEEYNSRLLQEAIYFNNLFLIYQCFGTENVMEMKYLAEELGNLQQINGDLKMEAGILRKKLEREKLEKSHLKDSVKQLDYEVYKSRDLNIQLNGQILDGNDLLFHKENELSETGEKLINVEALNMELCRTIEELEKECEESKLVRENLENQVSDFSLHSLIQNEEIEFLREVNGNLESEMGMLQKDFEQCRIRAGNLSSEVLKKSYESRFWEAESATFYFDLQISSVREILFKDKVLELTSVYESLKDESASKSMEIEQMKARVRILEGEIGGLETQLSAYGPVIHSLEENIASLERNAFFRTKLFMDDDQVQKEAEEVVDLHREPHKGQTATVPVGLSNLLNIQKRVKVVEKAVIKEIERLAMQEIFNANIKLEAAVKKTEDSKSENKLHRQKSVRKEGKLPLSKMRGDSDLHKIGSGRKRIFLKKTSLDRVLGCPQTIRWRKNVGPNDQMLMLRETREQGYCHSPIRQMTKMQASTTSFLQPCFEDIEQEHWTNSSKFLVNEKLGANKLDVSTSGMHSKQGINQIDILERQASNARKLQTLQMTVQDIKRKMELRKRSKKASKVAKYELVEEELQETEEAIVQLVDNNSQLMQNTEESPLLLAPAGLEVAQKGSEKIGRLQLEVQKMQYILLNLEDEKKRKGRYRVFKIRSRSRPSPHVREYIYSEGRSSEKHRKGCLSGCLRPSCEAD